VSYVDYKMERSRVRYHSALQVIPRTVCSSMIHGFEFNDEEQSDDDDDDDDEGYECDGSLENGDTSLMLSDFSDREIRGIILPGREILVNGC